MEGSEASGKSGPDAGAGAGAAGVWKGSNRDTEGREGRDETGKEAAIEREE